MFSIQKSLMMIKIIIKYYIKMLKSFKNINNNKMSKELYPLYRKIGNSESILHVVFQF